MKYDASMDTDREMPKMKPMVSLTSEDLESVSKWEVGESYTVLMELKQVRKSEDEEHGARGSFEITKIKELPKTKGSFSKDQVAVAMDMKKLDYLR